MKQYKTNLNIKFRHNIANLQALNFFYGLTLKVGILGGTFNPAHDGHRLISIQALNFYHFDYIIWLVANQNPLKPRNSNIFTRAQDAVNVSNHPKIIVSTAEHDLNCYYSYDSLKMLINRFSTINFTWIMGMDNILNFKKWYRFNEIKNLCDILIFDRPIAERMLNITLLELNNSASIDKTETHNIIMHRGKLCDSSSALIRSKNTS